MKKLKLLMALCALFVVGWNQVWAQKDVTAQYIKNSTLSSLDGWTVKNFNDPHKGNNTTGYASEAYSGYWNFDANTTPYYLKQTITLPAGHYTLVNYSFYREGEAYNTDASTSRAKLYAGSNEVAIKTLGSITAAGYANSQAEGANAFDSKMYRNTVDFTIDADNTAIEIGLTGTFTAMRSWCIAGMFELIDNDTEATMDAPFDVTGYMTNPGFEYRDLTGWTLSENEAFAAQGNNQSFKVGGYYAEKWQQTGALTARSMSQTLTNLPAGFYKLTANMGGDGTYIKLNDKTASWTTDGNYTVGYVLAENENLVVTAGKTAEGSASWIHFDNFKLQFCGDVAKALTTLCAQVSSYEGTVPTAVYTKLVSDVNAQNKTYSDVDELLAAIDAVQALYDAADAYKANYAAWLNMKSLADALVAIENTNSEANSTLSTAISDQNTAANNPADAAAVATATATLKDAMKTYVFAADPTDGNKFDCTFLIDTPDMTSLWTGAWNVVPAGWYTDQTGSNFQVMQNNKVDAEDGIHKVFTEFYYLKDGKTYDNGEFNIYTKLELPKGTYSMSCYAFAKEENYTSSNPTPAVYFYANDTQGSLVSSAKLTEQSISFINEEEQEVKIGLKPLTGNTYNWMGIGYVKLYKEYTDNTTYAISVGTVENGTVAITVDGETATTAKKLKTVTLTYTPDAGCVVSSVVATYNDGENDVNLDVANPSENVYTFQMPAYDVTVTSTIVVDKTALAAELADGIDYTSNVGTGVFQIPAAAATTFGEAVAAAQAVNDNASATATQVSEAVAALQAAKSTYANTTLNAPADGMRYYLKVATSGHTKEGNAVVVNLGATGDNNKTGYGFNAAAEPVAYMAQAFIFTQKEGNTYYISVERPEGTVYLTYGSLNNSAAGWNKQQIQGTTDASAKGEFKIVASTTDSQFNIYNTVHNDYIACEDGGSLYTNGTQTNFTLAEATQASVDIKISEAVKYATRIFPFTPTLPTGVKAYSTSVSGDQLTLNEEATPAANTPYVLYAESGYTGAALTGWGTAAATTYAETGGALTGVYEAIEAPDDSYVLIKDADGEVSFHLVDNTSKPTVGQYRAYLTAPNSARVLRMDFGATAVETLRALTAGEAEVYNAAGQRVPALQKGVNILRTKDGATRKVLVK